MSSEFTVINKEDMDNIYSLIKEKDGPVFFDYIVNYISQKKEGEINLRLLEQKLQSSLENDSRFKGFPDYYWYLSELIPDKTLVSDKELDKIEFYITNTGESVSLKSILALLKKEDDDFYKNCLTSRLHQDERFILVDKDLWNLKKEISKKVFRKPQEINLPETPSESVSLVELVPVLNNILREVEEVALFKESQKILVSKPSSVRYALFDTDISGGCMKIFSSMRHYFPDHPMIIQIKVCGRLKEYTAYLNNRTGYLRGLEDYFKEMSFSRGDVLHIIPMDLEKRVYRFFSRNEKNQYAYENWRTKQFQNLKSFYEKSPFSLTNLTLLIAKAFQDMEVHFDSIYEEVNAICPVSKELVNLILTKLPFCLNSSKSKDFWIFDDSKFNKFLLLGLTSLLGDMSKEEMDRKMTSITDTEAKEKITKDKLKVKDEKIKELQQNIESTKKEIEDMHSKMIAFEKLAEVRGQQINTITGNAEVLEEKVKILTKELEEARKTTPDTSVEVKQLKKKLISLQELFLNKKKIFIQLEKEKQELEKALLEMDRITSGLEKEKADLLRDLQAFRKEEDKKKESLIKKEDKFSEQQNKLEDLNKRLEEQQKKIEEQQKKIEEQQKKIEEKSKIEKEQQKKIEEKSKIEKEQQKKIEEQQKKIEEQLERISLQEERIQEQDEEINFKDQQIDQLKLEKASSRKEKELPHSIDKQVLKDYELKVAEKNDKISELENKLSVIEHEKIELENKFRTLQSDLAKMNFTIVEKESRIKILEKEMEASKSTGVDENQVKEFEERIEILEKELESKTSLYNTNLNMQFKLNKDIYKLQKSVDFFRDVIEFLSDGLLVIPQKESLNLTRMEELLSIMKSDEMGEEPVVITGLKALEETFLRLNNMLDESEELKKSYELYKEELEVARVYKDKYDLLSGEGDIHKEEIDKLQKQIDILTSDLKHSKEYCNELRQELQGMSKSFIGGKVMTKRLKSLITSEELSEKGK